MQNTFTSQDLSFTAWFHFILTAPPWSNYYYSHFIDEETEKVNILLKIAQKLSRRSRLSIQAWWSTKPIFLLCVTPFKTLTGASQKISGGSFIWKVFTCECLVFPNEVWLLLLFIFVKITIKVLLLTEDSVFWYSVIQSRDPGCVKDKNQVAFILFYFMPWNQ